MKGKVTEEVFENNENRWSGDHCIDPDVVPGVLFCNRKMSLEERPSIMDIAPTVLAAFGIERPAYMDGRVLEYEKAL